MKNLPWSVRNSKKSKINIIAKTNNYAMNYHKFEMKWLCFKKMLKDTAMILEQSNLLLTISMLFFVKKDRIVIWINRSLFNLKILSIQHAIPMITSPKSEEKFIGILNLSAIIRLKSKNYLLSSINSKSQIYPLQTRIKNWRGRYRCARIKLNRLKMGIRD